MKFENNNKEVIKRITKRSLKTNKIRNIFAVLAIVITTFMISSVFSIGVNFAKNYFTMNTRVDGTDADALLNNPTNDQISKIKSLNMCKHIGYEISAGTVEDKKLSDEKKCISLMYCDKVNFEKQITPAISDVSGKYPEKENEIMISTRSLEFLKMKNSKVGDKIKLKVNINKKTEDREFIISGIFTNYDMNTDMGSIFVSNSFIISKGLTLEKNGAVFMSIKSGSITSAEGKFQNSVHLNENQKFQFYYGDSFGETALYVSIVVLIITIFIMLSGYLLIYNVLYIGVTKDINFYGMLKTIGTSPYQIKKIVKGQALKLSVIGIPLGLLLGAAVSFGAVPMVLSMFSDGARKSAMPADISFNPLIFIGAALFSLLTVIISCRKPAKIAGNISPIEALRYTGVTSKKQKKSRNSTKGGKLYKISWYNVFRDKKRAFIVFLSLFMGIITFLSVNTFIDSMKVDNFIARYVPNDFEIENTNGDPDKMSDSMVNTIKNMEGIKDLNIFKVKSMQFEMNKDILGPAIKKSNNSVDKFIKEAESNPKLLQTNVIGVSDEMIEQLYKKNKEKFDVESFKQGKLIILDSWYYGENYKNVKGKITLKDSSGKKITKDVVVIKQDKNHLPEGALDNVGITPVYISDSELQKFNPDNYAVYINVEDKYEPQIKSQLKTMTKKYNLNFEAKTDQIKEFNNTNMVEKILGGGVSLILVFIGILNFINIMVTGIDTRLHELAVMESIGMTKKQIKKMLMFEGTYYAAITSFITCTLGTAIIYGISLLARKAADYAVFSFPTVQIVSIIICIFIICIITPVIVFKYSSKRSITERIRETEN